MKAFSSHSSFPFLYLDWACQLLLLLVFGGVLQRHYLTDSKDPNKCDALLNTGSWLDPGTPGTQSIYKNWQPEGCMMHKYTQKDMEQCLEGRGLVIAGDSTSRQIFGAVLEKMGHTLEQVAPHQNGRTNMHHDMKLSTSAMDVRFLWEPYWNGTSIRKELEAFHWNSSERAATPSTGLFFMRAPGLWLNREFSQFQKAINNTFQYANPEYMQQLGGNQEPSNLLLISPVQIPWYESMSDRRKGFLTPERLTPMNQYLEEVSPHGELPLVWSLANMISGEHSQGTHVSDGVHLISSVAHTQVDILLNLRCNAKHAAKGYPHSRTCCMTYNNPGAVQLGMMFCGVIMFLILAYNLSRAFSSSSPASKATENIGAMLTIVLVLVFCFLADRTHIFQKAQKQFSLVEFGILCGSFLILGLAAIRPIKKSSKPVKEVDELFLSRDQTDEWKGWMQVLILIYHYTGASPVTEIYKVIRLLVSAYLLLTGYGNTLSLLQRPDFGLKKVMGTVLRLNLLTVGLSYMMGTNYLFYYFPALATFWYLIIYIVLAVGYHKNDDFYFVCCKIIIATFTTTALVLIPGIMEPIGDVLKIIFKVDWDIPEWRFRLNLDLYIIYVGMLVALVHYRSRAGDDFEVATSSTQKFMHWCAGHKSKLGGAFMLLLVCGYVLISRTFPDKYAYNHFHPYISWIPILGFIALRNSHEVIQSYYSTMFAWVGQISLETYVLQYHIWLAGDTKGLLRLGLFNRWVEAAIITPLFVWISWRTSEATRIVVKQMIAVANPENRRDLEEGDGYALLPTYSDNQPDADPNVETLNMDSPATETAEIPSEKKKKVARGCVQWLISTRNKLSGDLRWRLFVIIMVLWVANLVADAQKRGFVGLSWTPWEKDE